MMMQHIASAVYKRATEGSTPQYDLPSWSWAVILADFIVFLPFILVVSPPPRGLLAYPMRLICFPS